MTIEHDAAACALAEFRWGLGRELPRDATLVYLTCGTGFGAGLVLGGRVYHGAAGRSPELGHARYRDDGPTAFGKRGCFEAWCAGSSLPRLAALHAPARWSAAPPDGAELLRLRGAGDADAATVIAQHARATGHACALLADLLFPHAIALGSLARYLGEPWMAAVRDTFAAEALPDAVALCRLAPAGLGPRLQDLSALAAAAARRSG